MPRWIVAFFAALFALLAPACHAEEAAELNYAGKTALVTGSTDGLGRELARALAAEGAHVIVHGRNVERGEALVAEIAASGKGSARFYPADFASMQAVRSFAGTIAADYPKLDLLVNNAGIARVGGERMVSPDGYELHFAINYLAGWILTNRLRPNLAAAAPARVINVASGSAQPIDFDDVMMEKPGARNDYYGQSKLAQVTMTRELAPAFLEDGITMISLHPATLMDTSMVIDDLKMTPRTSVEDGRDHVMGLIKSPALEAGEFYVAGNVTKPRFEQPFDPEARARLVAVSTELTGVPLAQ